MAGASGDRQQTLVYFETSRPAERERENKRKGKRGREKKEERERGNMKERKSICVARFPKAAAGPGDSGHQKPKALTRERNGQAKRKKFNLKPAWSPVWSVRWNRT